MNERVERLVKAINEMGYLLTVTKEAKSQTYHLYFETADSGIVLPTIYSTSTLITALEMLAMALRETRIHKAIPEG